MREVAEESGYEVRAVKLAAVYDYRKRNRPRHLDSICKLFFICELLGGSARASIETSEVAFFSRDRLPALSVGRTTTAQIERMFEHAEEPGCRRISIESISAAARAPQALATGHPSIDRRARGEQQGRRQRGARILGHRGDQCEHAARDTIPVAYGNPNAR